MIIKFVYIEINLIIIMFEYK